MVWSAASEPRRKDEKRQQDRPGKNRTLKLTLLGCNSGQTEITSPEIIMNTIYLVDDITHYETNRQKQLLEDQ